MLDLAYLELIELGACCEQSNSNYRYPPDIVALHPRPLAPLAHWRSRYLRMHHDPLNAPTGVLHQPKAVERSGTS